MWGFCGVATRNIDPSEIICRRPCTDETDLRSFQCCYLSHRTDENWIWQAWILFSATSGPECAHGEEQMEHFNQCVPKSKQSDSCAIRRGRWCPSCRSTIPHSSASPVALVNWDLEKYSKQSATNVGFLWSSYSQH